MKKYTINIATKLDSKLAKEWKRLWLSAENSNVFNSPEWFLACINAYKIKDYKIYRVYRNKELVALLPIRDYRRFGIKVGGSLCNRFLYDTSFLMLTYEDNLLKILFEEVASRGSFYITRVDNDVAVRLKRIFPRMFSPLLAASPYIELNNYSFRLASKSNNRKIRSIIRKNRKELGFRVF